MRAFAWLFAALMLCITVESSFGQSYASGLLKRTEGDAKNVKLHGVTEGEVMQFRGGIHGGLPAISVWRFGEDRAVLRGPYVLLRDGSRLAAPLLTSERELLTFTADEIDPGLWDGMSLPLSEVQAILWKTPIGKRSLATCLDLMKPVDADTLRLDNGDQVRGEFRGIVLNEATQAEEIVFAVRDLESRIALARAVSLQLANRKKDEKRPTRTGWTLAFLDGSRVLGSRFVLGEEKATWNLGDGQKKEMSAELFADHCTLLEPPRRSLFFLSDLKEQSYRHFPTFGEAAVWKADRCATGEPLRHGGAYYEKGLGMWSSSRLSFAVPKSAIRFQAEIGIDDHAGDRGSAVFRVLAQFPSNKEGDKGSELKDLYKSEVLRGGDPSREVSVDITGASTLILLVEAADQGETLDLADWIDARFVISPAEP